MCVKSAQALKQERNDMKRTRMAAAAIGGLSLVSAIILHTQTTAGNSDSTLKARLWLTQK